MDSTTDTKALANVSTDAPHPSVSTGANDGILDVEIVYGKRRRRMHRWMWADSPVKVNSANNVTGKERAFLAKYFEMKGMVGCARKFPGCMAPERFPDLTKADFDHIDGVRTHNVVGNFAPNCPPCNKRAQALQSKQIRLLASKEREREMAERSNLPSQDITSHAEFVSVRAFPGAVKMLFGRDGYLEKPGQHRPKKWLIGIMPEKVGAGRSTTHAKYVNDEFIPQGYLTEQDFPTEKGKETHLVRTGKDASKMIERELGKL